MSKITKLNQPTMTSREIADLMGKRHDHVMRDIRNMLKELYGAGGVLKFGDTQVNEQNGQVYPIFRLPKRETLILVSGYSVGMRAKIIDRWQELEDGAADRTRSRHLAASAYKLMSTVLQDMREAVGKRVAPYHFMNEAKLVNHVITGEFKGLDRDKLSLPQLDLLGELEVKNAALMVQGLAYDERKKKLAAFAAAWRAAHPSNPLLGGV